MSDTLLDDHNLWRSLETILQTLLISVAPQLASQARRRNQLNYSNPFRPSADEFLRDSKFICKNKKWVMNSLTMNRKWMNKFLLYDKKLAKLEFPRVREPLIKFEMKTEKKTNNDIPWFVILNKMNEATITSSIKRLKKELNPKGFNFSIWHLNSPSGLIATMRDVLCVG